MVIPRSICLGQWSAHSWEMALALAGSIRQDVGLGLGSDGDLFEGPLSPGPECEGEFEQRLAPSPLVGSLVSGAPRACMSNPSTPGVGGPALEMFRVSLSKDSRPSQSAPAPCVARFRTTLRKTMGPLLGRPTPRVYKKRNVLSVGFTPR